MIFAFCMSMVREHDELAEMISKSYGQNRDKERNTKFIAGCLQVIYAHIEDRVCRGFLPEEKGYVDFLCSIGFLEELPKGKSIQPARYEFTDKARKFIRKDY